MILSLLGQATPSLSSSSLGKMGVPIFGYLGKVGVPIFGCPDLRARRKGQERACQAPRLIPPPDRAGARAPASPVTSQTPAPQPPWGYPQS
jgi:hypothetical protein